MTVALAVVASVVAFVSGGEASPVRAAAATSSYVAVTPTRLFDTRSATGMQAQEVREFQISGGVVPASATAVMLNVTATRSLSSGYLQVFPTGRSGVDTSSTLNLDFAGQTIPNAAFAPLGDGGKVSIYTTFPTDILIDVFGYFVPATSATAGRFVPLAPTRILDTRVNLGWTPPPPTIPSNPGDSKNCSDFATQAAAQEWFDTYFPFFGDIANLDADGDGVACESLPLTVALQSAALVSARTTITLQVAGRGGVPTSGASAVVMNVTAAGPTSDGWVQVSPTGVAVGETSNLNPEKDRTIANLVVVPLGVDGRVDLKTYLYELGGTVDLLADVVGYFTDNTAPPSTAGLFVPIAPTRALDTRQPPPKPEVGAGQTVGVDFASVAPGASAIAGNLTSASGGPGGFLQLAPTIGVPGASSSLNTSYENQTIANAVVSPVTATGTGQIFTYGSTHIILDVTGWFTGSSSNAATALQQLAALGTTSGPPGESYNRDEWLPSWADADGDCQNTRHEVLIDEADGPLTFGAGNCTVTLGTWNDPYTGSTFTLPSDLDIDHMVPLADAHRSGGWAWSTIKKRAYANDLDNTETLIAVDDGSNSSKSDQSPDQWLPPNGNYRCTYVIEWVSVKATWGLTVTTPERVAIGSSLSTC